MALSAALIIGRIAGEKKLFCILAKFIPESIKGYIFIITAGYDYRFFL